MRILVAELHHLGDALLSFPFIRGAMARGDEVHVLCRTSVAPLYRRILPAAQILAWDPPWHEETKQKTPPPDLRARGFDLAVCVWPDPRVHVLFRSAGIPRRVSYRVDARNFYGARMPWRQATLRKGRILTSLVSLGGMRPLLTGALDKTDENQAHLESWNQLAAHLGIEPALATPWLKTEAPPVPVRGMLGDNLQIWMVHPGARSPLRRWEPAKYQSILQDLASRGDVGVVVVRPPGGTALEIFGRKQILVDLPSLDHFIDLAGAVDCVLCNDSFAAHLGAALGKKVVSIFGPMTPDWFAPFANREHLVEAPVCPHRPCLDRCVMPSPICIEAVTVEMVRSKMRPLLPGTVP